jgi:hypothetical protein
VSIRTFRFWYSHKSNLVRYVRKGYVRKSFLSCAGPILPFSSSFPKLVIFFLKGKQSQEKLFHSSNPCGKTGRGSGKTGRGLGKGRMRPRKNS